MAKKRSAGGVNKSEAIRNYLAANPQASPNEIVAGLKQQGVSVSPGLVSNVKYSKPRAGGKKRRGRPPGRRAKREGATNGALTAADLLEAKKLVDQLGGIDQAQQALATLDELR